MSFKIGFTPNTTKKKGEEAATTAPVFSPALPRKSLVRVYFPARDLTCSYYNDAYDLHPGDTVYVEGKLEGLRGQVVEVSYTFKIKLADYKRVIGLADTEVHGQFFMGGSHFITFDPTAIPFEKVRTWFKAPDDPEDLYEISTDGSAFPLMDLTQMKIAPHIAERGENYYLQNRVAYLSIDGIRGRAIVEGSEIYEVEFAYKDGMISDMTCDCYCTGACKHQFAVMLQLRETLKIIEEQYQMGNYFAAVRKNVLFSTAIDHQDRGGFTL